MKLCLCGCLFRAHRDPTYSPPATAGACNYCGTLQGRRKCNYYRPGLCWEPQLESSR